MLLIESGIVVLILLLAFLLPKAGSSLFAALERGLADLARHRILSVFVVGLTALIIRLAVLPILPIPYPGLNDEFSYQLMADTFAHGRLTNPTHPMWIHFENISVIHQPTYCSVYYPAQGLFLALGQLVGKHPFWGVWLSVGLMSGAICWMLQAWVAPFWALLGGLLVAIRIGTFSYWANSYFGGTVAAIGGALVLGALPRLLKRREPGHSVIMGLGFAILGMSRPFESVFFVIPVVVVLALRLWSHRIQLSRPTLLRAILPCLGIVALAVCFMLYYFWRTTGHPLLPPYIVNLRRYTVEPTFPWLPLHTIPHYNHEFIKRYFLGYNLTMYHMARLHPAAMAMIKLLMLWFFFLGPLLTLPFLALGFVLGYGMKLRDISPRVRFLLITCAATVFGMLLPVYIYPHYAAPITCAIYALMMLALQRLRGWRVGERLTGLFLIRATLAAVVVMLAIRIAAPVFHLSLVNSNRPQTWCSPWYQLIPREEMEKQLEAIPGEQLVLVHFSPEHDPNKDWPWVSNSSDIDHSKIVWAYDMEPKENEELLRYFSKRQVWIAYPDDDPIGFSPYGAKTPF